MAALPTIATNHSKALLATHHRVAESLVGGYHFAFVIGAACVSASILVAVAVRRGRPAPAPSDADDVQEPADLQAA